MPLCIRFKVVPVSEMPHMLLWIYQNSSSLMILINANKQNQFRFPRKPWELQRECWSTGVPFIKIRLILTWMLISGLVELWSSISIMATHAQTFFACTNINLVLRWLGGWVCLGKRSTYGTIATWNHLHESAVTNNTPAGCQKSSTSNSTRHKAHS